MQWIFEDLWCLVNNDSFGFMHHQAAFKSKILQRLLIACTTAPFFSTGQPPFLSLGVSAQLKSPPTQSRSQSFVPLDQRSGKESSGSIHFKKTMEITEFCISGLTAQCAVHFYSIYGACLKWMLPELSFSNRWSRGTKLWERDCLQLKYSHLHT